MDCVDIKVGYTCNNDCLHCVTADKRRYGDLSAEQIKREIAFYSDRGEAVLVITGGEPTIRPELVEIVRYARATGFRHIELQTNARALADGDLARALADAGLTSALVALHAPVAEAHDRITQRPGGFAETVQGIRNLVAAGVQVRMNMVISLLNLGSVEEMVPFLAAGLPEVRLGQLTFPHPDGNALANFDLIVPRLAEAAEVVVRTLRRGLRRQIWFMVEAIPPCLLPGFEKHNLELRGLEVVGTDVASGAPDGRITDYRQLLRAEKEKGEQCARCCLGAVCDGIWKQYADRFGTAELRPLSGLDPAYVVSD